jgi:hypothetical protein
MGLPPSKPSELSQLEFAYGSSFESNHSFYSYLFYRYLLSPPKQRLAKFPFSLGADQLLSRFLDSFKSARTELKSADRTIEIGTVAFSYLGMKLVPSSVSPALQ